MSYDTNKLTKLEALKQLAEKVKGVTDTLETKANATATYATKTELGDYAKKTEITSVYKPAGSVAQAGLAALAVEGNVGNVYNVTEQFTAGEEFVTEEVGKTYPAGTNVVVIKVEEAYKLDALAGFVDLSNYVQNETLGSYALKTDLNKYTETTELEANYAKKSELPKDFTAATEAAGTHGLVPAPQVGDSEKFLKADGTWDVPHDTTYENATDSEAGLMSANDKKKLDGMQIADDAEVTEMLEEIFTA